MFSVKKTVADKGLTPFPFEDNDGNPQTLPNFMLMTAKRAGKFAERLESDPLGAFAEIAPDMAETILATPIGAVSELVQAYMDHCKGEGDAGEASASPAPSKSTARPSKSTSRASTAQTRKR